MNPAFAALAIRAEIKRARRDYRDIDRLYLHRETGLKWNDLEAAIARVSKQMREDSAGSLAPAVSAAKGTNRAAIRPGRPVGPPVKRWRGTRKSQGE